MALISCTDIKGIHDTIINAFDADLQNSKINYYSTPEQAALARTVAVRMNELTNAISDFVVGTNMSASIMRFIPGACTVEVHDTSEYNDNCFGFKIIFLMNSRSFGTEVDMVIDSFENRTVVKDSDRPTGWRADCCGRSKSMFKRFGAMRMHDGRYRIKHDAFIAAIPEMIKFFNESKSLRCNRENNAKLISEIKVGLRKREVKSIQFDSILSLAEEWVKGIDPDLNIIVKNISPAGSATRCMWRLRIVNTRPVINDEYVNISKDHFHHVLTSPLPCGTDGVFLGRDLNVKDWVLKNSDALTPEQRDEYIKEAERLPAKLANLYTCDPRFVSDQYHRVNGLVAVSFIVTLDLEHDSWCVQYERKELLPRRFQKLLDFGNAVKFKNLESVIKYMAHCIHVEEVLWKKADEQWYELANAFKEDPVTREFFANVCDDTGNPRQDAFIDNLVDCV